MDRVDVYPTHEHAGYRLRAGRTFPFGATFVPGGVNFSVFSSHGTACTLVLFRRGQAEPLVEIPFLERFRIGSVFAMIIFDLELRGDRIRLPHGRPVRPACRPSLRPGAGAARPLRPRRWRPGSLGA